MISSERKNICKFERNPRFLSENVSPLPMKGIGSSLKHLSNGHKKVLRSDQE